MSIHTRTKRMTVPQLVAMKGQQKIVSLTAYSSAIAKLIDPLVDFILVGDSTAMVGYGRPSTLSMQLEEIIGHTRAVVDSTHLACVIADMPFGTYQESREQALRSATVAAQCLPFELFGFKRRSGNGSSTVMVAVLLMARTFPGRGRAAPPVKEYRPSTAQIGTWRPRT